MVYGLDPCIYFGKLFKWAGNPAFTLVSCLSKLGSLHLLGKLSKWDGILVFTLIDYLGGFVSLAFTF